MINYFMKKYAMSQTGANNLRKAVFSRTILNLTKMFPPMIAFMFIFQSLSDIRCVLQYINLKIYDNIKVTELAKQFYLSESALRSRFKEEIGVPINEYVNKRKIEESKMMIWSGIPAGEIARRLSFYDLSHYYRTFKKYTGVTPQQFRDTNIIGQEM